jgi:hypothetical protein
LSRRKLALFENAATSAIWSLYGGQRTFPNRPKTSRMTDGVEKGLAIIGEQ